MTTGREIVKSRETFTNISGTALCAVSRTDIRHFAPAGFAAPKHTLYIYPLQLYALASTYKSQTTLEVLVT